MYPCHWCQSYLKEPDKQWKVRFIPLRNHQSHERDGKLECELMINSLFRLNQWKCQNDWRVCAALRMGGECIKSSDLQQKTETFFLMIHDLKLLVITYDERHARRNSNRRLVPVQVLALWCKGKTAGSAACRITPNRKRLDRGKAPLFSWIEILISQRRAGSCICALSLGPLRVHLHCKQHCNVDTPEQALKELPEHRGARAAEFCTSKFTLLLGLTHLCCTG